jgi:gliding motility-associated-like protein
MMNKFLLFTFIFLFGQASFAQIFFSDGATIQVNSGANVISNGGMEITNSSTFTNNGTVGVTKNSTFPSPGNFEINSTATVNGDGTLKVEQDFINDATFNGGNSMVELFGNTQQFITSTNGTVTTFNDLKLTGTGTGNNRKKTLLNVDANTGTNGNLILNDRELATDIQSFFVLNTSPTAISNITTPGAEGFVSSLAPGLLSRVTNSTSTFLFPTGSSLGTLRYRPIEVVPTAAAANTYTVRMNNNDATADGFDRTVNDGVMCILNDLYYHSIQRSVGVTSSDIRMFYIGANDGTWTGMGHWRLTNTQWNDMATMTLATSGVFNTVTRPAWLFANPGDPYILTTPAPQQPIISCPTVCENSGGNLFTLTGSSPTYTWTVPANGTIASGQGTDNINVDWTTGTGYVYVFAVDANGCVSLPDSCLPVVSPTPNASFTSTSSGTYNDIYQFTDQSTGANGWIWNFGDGNTSTSQDPNYVYSGGGTYTVTLIATNAAGCSDTATLTVISGEGIVIPNVFSPNGDTRNDLFEIQSSGLNEFSLQIFDRWGLLMFETTDINTGWNGKNMAGKLCPEGTYYFILTAISDTNDWSKAGHLTLLTTR